MHLGREAIETTAIEAVARTNEYPSESQAEDSPAQASAVGARPWFDEPAPMPEKNFASVEDALPESDESSPPPNQPSAPSEEALPAEPKPGLFERLLRLSGRSMARPSLEIEIHEERIAAAADALDAAGEQTFAEDQEAPVGSTDAFASVEEALPDARFAPPVNTLEFLELEAKPEPAADASPFFGDTLELVPDTPETKHPAAFFGDTLEIIPPERRVTTDSTPYFGDTLDPEQLHETTELEEDTDEFEVVVAPPPTQVPADVDVDGDTAQVSRKSLLERLAFWRANAQAELGALEGGSTIVEGSPVFLFSKFRTFYNEIIRSKHQKSEFTAGFSTAIVTDYSADLSPDGAAESLSKNLAAMLELQAAEAMWMGGESAERYPDAQYAMAALADELFLYTEWEGQGAWQKNLIEVRLFKTHAADVELFKRIDRLLKDQSDSPAARDLARVYLFVIAAGFRGKYRQFGLTRALAEYRQRLYEYIHEGGDALMIYAAGRRIFPEAAERTLEGEAISRFTAAQRWAAILVFLVVSYTVIAHLAWSRVSADLKDVTDRIIAGSTTTGNR